MKNKLFTAFQYLVPQHALSRLVGNLAETENKAIKNWLIQRFINSYGVNMAESLRKTPDEFRCFNDFFTRELEEGARKISSDVNHIVSPADGAISQLGDIENGRIFQAKGQSFTTGELLGGDHETAALFSRGKFATIYLSPKDYHRVHMPLDGKLISMSHVPGDLFSVNQATAENVPRLFARNERVCCLFETPIGPMVMVLVGAMIVASIETVWSGLITPQKKTVRHWNYKTPESIELKKGEEMGRFKLGSTVVLLLPNNVEFDDRYEATTPLRMGEKLAEFE